MELAVHTEMVVVVEVVVIGGAEVEEVVVRDVAGADYWLHPIKPITRSFAENVSNEALLETCPIYQ